MSNDFFDVKDLKPEPPKKEESLVPLFNDIFLQILSIVAIFAFIGVLLYGITLMQRHEESKCQLTCKDHKAQTFGHNWDSCACLEDGKWILQYPINFSK
jgi:hypothetical protein